MACAPLKGAEAAMSPSLACECSSLNNNFDQDRAPAAAFRHALEASDPASPSPPKSPAAAAGPDAGVVAYASGLHLPLMGPPVRQGEVLHLLPDDHSSFERVNLALYCNGFAIHAPDKPRTAISWSPFSLVQACRLHTAEADLQAPGLRLFKLSVFAHGSTHFFATSGDKADLERATWVADIARALRVLTLSLFPPFSIQAHPVREISCTASRLLAGYLLLCDENGVCVLYCELHAHFNGAAAFAMYEDESCAVQVMRLAIDVHTCVSERVGVDCSCFSVDGHLFSTRTCAEKMLWLRAVSNVKVKLRHHSASPTTDELEFYRKSVLESAATIRQKQEDLTRSSLLPVRKPRALGLQAEKEAAAAGVAAANGMNATNTMNTMNTLSNPDTPGKGDSLPAVSAVAASPPPLGAAVGPGAQLSGTPLPKEPSLQLSPGGDHDAPSFSEGSPIAVPMPPEPNDDDSLPSMEPSYSLPSVEPSSEPSRGRTGAATPTAEAGEARPTAEGAELQVDAPAEEPDVPSPASANRSEAPPGETVLELDRGGVAAPVTSSALGV